MSNPLNVQKDYYVFLTGSKNNAGDYLIKYSAKELLKSLRPDREIIDIDAWKKIDEETLKIINGSKALILMGGPALQKNMVPNVYPLVDDLSEIRVPICMMGVGWKSLNGDWADTQNYPLSERTVELLRRINEDGLYSSVRDFHTFNVLKRYSVDNVIMTGCPATYVQDFFETPLPTNLNIKKVGFSLGVSFLDSSEMKRQMQNVILSLKDYFGKECSFEVVFHHSTNKEFLQSHNATSKHLSGHLQFIEWLKANDIQHVDISGSAENLINYYSSCDIHIGYRVHAHIFMSSISKHSILIAEDGRGKALRNVFGGVVIDAFQHVSNGFISKVLRKLNILSGFKVDPSVHLDLLKTLEYEQKFDFPEVSAARQKINHNFKAMEYFIKSLP